MPTATKRKPPVTTPADAKADAQAEVKALATQVARFPTIEFIEDAQGLEVAHRQQLQLADIKKQLKAKKDGILKLLKLVEKEVKELFAEPERRVEAALAATKVAIASYNLWLREQQEAERAKLAKKIESGKLTEAQAGARVARLSEELGAAHVSARKHAVMRIVDPSKVHDRYWVIDEVALRADALAAHKNERPLPTGVEVVEEEIIVNR